MNDELLRKYARLAVCSGANVQPGQLLVIKASVRDYKFVEMCVLEAYKAKAGQVKVSWSDEVVSKMNYQYCSLDTLKEVADYRVDEIKWEHDKGCAYLYIDSDTPGFFKDVDADKMHQASLEWMKKTQPYREYTMSSIGQWSIVAVPSVGWAKQLFPNDSEEVAVEKLWDAILMTVRISKDNDPVLEWQQHDDKLADYCKKLNELNFDKLHFTNSLGTDLYVSLVKDHIWAGGAEISQKGIVFNPNMPTEEVFCMPHKDHVEGKVYATKPLALNGKVVENFWLEFKDGKVVDFNAEKEYDALKKLLDTDDGVKHLGEVALISYDSPIQNSGILFFNTLFDENASCHLALGACYPQNVKGGFDMDEKQLASVGGNSSLEHVDFMFGSKDMQIVGIKHDGSTVEVFKDGNFCI